MIFFIAGEVVIPPNFLYACSAATVVIELQDTSSFPSIKISKLTMDVPYLGYKSIPFALSYPPTKLDSDTNEWYTLRVVIRAKEDDGLLCFNRRVTRAIDDNGAPFQNVKVGMMTAGRKGKDDPAPPRVQARNGGTSVVLRETSNLSRQRRDPTLSRHVWV